MKNCPTCPTRPGYPIAGDGFTRRGFLRVGGTGLVASFFSSAISASLREAATAVSPSLQRTAKNCIVIFLEGAPSHVDLWDLKEGPWTPRALAPTSYSEVRWPQGYLPKTAEHLSKLTFIRSAMSWVAVHPLGQLWAQIGRNPAGPLGNIAPHIGSVVAIEAQRGPRDILPTFVALEEPRAAYGYFSAKYGPLTLRTAGGVSTLSHGDGESRLTRRLSMLQDLDPDRRGDLGKEATDFGAFYDDCFKLTTSPEIANVFAVGDTDRERYGSSSFGDSMVLAKQLIASQRGTRFVQISHPDWDHHNDLYAQLPGRTREFDPAFGALLTDLAATPGVDAGKTLLDETLILVYSEFGRTTGPLNVAAGRDHFPRMSIVLAGGGTRGGRVIGQTDAVGNKATEYGWLANRDIRPEDIACTLYSALGIDYTTVRRDDPLNRGFEYVPFAKDGIYLPVNEVFA